MPKGLQVQEFDKWWNKQFFDTTGPHKLVHEIHRWLFTQPRIDKVLKIRPIFTKSKNPFSTQR